MFDNGRKIKTYLVIGLGSFGIALCERLTEIGAHVIGVDKSRVRVEEMSDKLEYAAQLDATDEASLIKIGAKEVDAAIVSVGDHLEGTVFITTILRELGVPNIIVRAGSELEGRILAKVGAHQIVRPEKESGRRVADLLERPWMSHLMESSDGKIIFGEIAAPPGIIGQTLAQLELPKRYGCVVALVERDGRRIMPMANMKIKVSDKLWFCGEKDRLGPLLSTINTDNDTVEESE